MRSAGALSLVIVVSALVLLPYAIRQSGSAGPLGVAAAAAISLVSAWAAEGFAFMFSRAGNPLGGLLTGMAARMAPPLVICLILAAQGAGGRQHLTFICYLLGFYLVTLTLETWLAVKRAQRRNSNLNHLAR